MPKKLSEEYKKILCKTRFKINEYRDVVDVKPYTPTQIRVAYNIPEDAKGQGKIIAIIDAYGNKNLLNDLNVFNKEFNLPEADIEIKYPKGEPSEVDLEWAIETNLDVQWAHALAPLAKIIVVITKDASIGSLFDAIEYTTNLDVDIVSMSWGTDEFSQELLLDSFFSKNNIAFFAASGDSGSVIYPSSSPNVISVGGTSFELDDSGRRIATEIAWVGSGGGVSEYEPRPSWQDTICKAYRKKNNRTTPDVAFFGDTFPGVAVYTSSNKVSKNLGWLGVGGTSVAAPCWAAIAASIKTDDKKYTNLQKMLYKLFCKYSNGDDSVFYDVKNGNNKNYYASVGYDYVTGLGSPIVNKLLDLYSNEENRSENPKDDYS